MDKGSPPRQHSRSDFVRPLRSLAKAALLAVGLYVFFPPFWDAAFEADLDSLHEAPYIAAKRARHLWHRVSDGFREIKDQGDSGLAAAARDNHR